MPVRTIAHSANYCSNRSLSSVSTSPVIGLQYSRDTFLSLNTTSALRLDRKLATTLADLGIGCRLKARRSKRGGRRRQRQIPVLIPHSAVIISTPDSVSQGCWQSAYTAFDADDVVEVTEPSMLDAAHAYRIRKRDFECSRNVITINTRPRQKYMTVCCYNAQSVAGVRMRYKRMEITNLVREDSVDICFITETWLKCQGDEASMVDMTPPGYSLRSIPRAMRVGGLVLLLCSNIFDHATVTSSFLFSNKSFELEQCPVAFFF